jgi:hypothetical protein
MSIISGKESQKKLDLPKERNPRGCLPPLFFHNQTVEDKDRADGQHGIP